MKITSPDHKRGNQFRIGVHRYSGPHKEITEGLDQGGLTHQAKNLYATVYPTLLRMEQAGDVVRVGKGQWGLADWYPAGRKPAQEEKTEPES